MTNATKLTLLLIVLIPIQAAMTVAGGLLVTLLPWILIIYGVIGVALLATGGVLVAVYPQTLTGVIPKELP